MMAIATAMSTQTAMTRPTTIVGMMPVLETLLHSGSAPLSGCNSHNAISFRVVAPQIPKS